MNDKYETFNEQLSNEASATHAKRDAHRDLAPPAQRSAEQQIADVRAGDEQHDARDTEQPAWRLWCRRPGSVRAAASIDATITLRLGDLDRRRARIQRELFAIALLERAREIGGGCFDGHAGFAARVHRRST